MKTENFPKLLAGLYEPGQITSLGATQLGELYANFGVLSVLLLPIVTVLLMMLSAGSLLANGKHLLVSAALFLLLIWSARASFEDNVITFVFVLLLIRGFGLSKNLNLAGDLQLTSAVEG